MSDHADTIRKALECYYRVTGGDGDPSTMASLAALDALVAEVDRLIAERQRLTDENDKAVRALWDEKNKFMEALEAEQRDKGFALAEVERLGVLLAETEGERVGWKDRAEAAEAEVARLREALDTMLTAIRFALSDSPEAIVSDGVARWADADGVEHSGPFLASGGEAALAEDA